MGTYDDESSHEGTMSGRTLNVASRIYSELQSMIRTHGDEVITELMPLIVSVLEELDIAYQECDDAVQAIEELRDELAQAKQETKRQRQLRELVEEEKTGCEDALEKQKKQLASQHDQLHSHNKSLSLNLSAKKEYIDSLEGRMVELERDHRDLERRHISTVQQLVSSKKTIREQSSIIENSSASENKFSFSTSTPKKTNNYFNDYADFCEEREECTQFRDAVEEAGKEEDEECDDSDPENHHCEDENLGDELQKQGLFGDEMADEEEVVEEKVRRESEEKVRRESEEGDMIDDGEKRADSEGELEVALKITASDGAQRNELNLFDELNRHSAGIPSPTKHENLIYEADSFLSEASRKDSLAAVRDNEMSALLREKQDLETLRNKLVKENNELLTTLNETKDEAERAAKRASVLEGENANMFSKLMDLEMRVKQLNNMQQSPPISKSSQGSEEGSSDKRFTRCEMDKVIREKNLYKEKYLELQEDVSTRYVEIQTEGVNEKSKFWNLFSGLFARKREASVTEDTKVKFSAISSDEKSMERKTTKPRPSAQDRLFAQGWSLPSDVAREGLSNMDFIQQIPAPIYCGPLGVAGKSEVGGGERKSLVRCCATADSSDPLANRNMTWVCCEQEGQGEVFIVDPANPNEIKQSFVATKSSIICVSYVPAASPVLELGMVRLNEDQLSDSNNEEEEAEEDDDAFEVCNVRVAEQLFRHRPTFWMGTQNGFVTIHSAVEQCDVLLRRARLKDSVLEIRHCKDEEIVLAGCADSSVAIFGKNNNSWDLDNYRLVYLGKTSTNLPVSVIVPIRDKVAWVGYGGNIGVLTLSPKIEMKESHVFSESERSLVTHMVPIGQGVWIACKFSCIITLLDSASLQPLQQVNMEEVLKPVSVSYGFTTLIRVSAVLCHSNLLWIGTSQGAMVTIPLKSIAPTSYITEPPAADQVPMFAVKDEARISLHGHQGAVRFILVANYRDEISERRNSDRRTCTRIVLSGGEGYISYRDIDAGTLSTIRRGRIIRGFTDHCHLIAWDVSGQTNSIT